MIQVKQYQMYVHWLGHVVMRGAVRDKLERLQRSKERALAATVASTGHGNSGNHNIKHL